MESISVLPVGWKKMLLFSVFLNFLFEREDKPGAFNEKILMEIKPTALCWLFGLNVKDNMR